MIPIFMQMIRLPLLSPSKFAIVQMASRFSLSTFECNEDTMYSSTGFSVRWKDCLSFPDAIKVKILNVSK